MRVLVVVAAGPLSGSRVRPNEELKPTATASSLVESFTFGAAA
jgi:hypothetical protein